MRTARVSVPGVSGVVLVDVAENAAQLLLGGQTLSIGQARFAPAADGLVYGVILNDHDTVCALGAALLEAPYQAPPRAPALYIKPYNTHVGHGASVHLPAGAARVEVLGTLGIVFGAQATRVQEAHALGPVGGFTIVADLTLPYQSLYRPPIREKCFDGACPIGPWVVSKEAIADPDGLEVRVSVNGTVQQQRSLRGLVRAVPRLIADVTAFLTLYPGDVLLAGVPLAGPSAAAGDTIAVEIPGVGRLEATIEAAI